MRSLHWAVDCSPSADAFGNSSNCDAVGCCLIRKQRNSFKNKIPKPFQLRWEWHWRSTVLLHWPSNPADRAKCPNEYYPFSGHCTSRRHIEIKNCLPPRTNQISTPPFSGSTKKIKQRYVTDVVFLFWYFEWEEPKSGHAHAAACEPRRPETHRHQRHTRRFFFSSFSEDSGPRRDPMTRPTHGRRNNCYSRKTATSTNRSFPGFPKAKNASASSH